MKNYNIFFLHIVFYYLFLSNLKLLTPISFQHKNMNINSKDKSQSKSWS